MKQKFLFTMFVVLMIVTTVKAQRPYHHGDGHPKHKDSTGTPEMLEQKPEKGPNKGKMMRNGELKVEMVTPTNTSKPEVSYFIYDSLNHVLDAKLYTGSVKYVFGDATQFIQVKLIATATGKNNQYIATLEDWKDYKQAIVTIKRDGKVYNFVYFNMAAVRKEREGSDQPSNMGPNRNSQPMMNGGGMNGGGMNGGGMNPGRGY